MRIGISKLFEDAERLVDQRRLIPAVRTMEEVRRLTKIPDRRAWASYNLGAIFFHMLGDGEASRREFLAAIRDFEEHGYGERPQLKILYANALENAMLCALSYNEFEDLAVRLEGVNPGVPILTGLVPAVREGRERGEPWSDRLLDLAYTCYNRNDPKLDKGRYGQAKSTYHLLLAHRRDLRVSREDWRLAVSEYCVLAMRIAADCMKVRGGDNDAHSPEEFLPILTEAMPLVDEYLLTNTGDEDLKKFQGNMDEMVSNARQRWVFVSGGGFASQLPLISEIVEAAPVFSGETDEQSLTRQYPGKWSRLINLLVCVLFCPPLLVAFAFSPPECFLSFITMCLISFLPGKSRRVQDPVSGIFEFAYLSPRDFHEWAKLVCTSNRYEKLYLQYVLNAKEGVKNKLPFTFSQIKAINYIHAWKVIIILLIPLNIFCLYDLLWSNQSFRSPILVGATTGVLWGYSLGIYVLWRTCRRYRSPGDLPM